MIELPTTRKDLLTSPDLITSTVLMNRLGITRGAADNALSQWMKDGFLIKLSAGCYLSNFVKHNSYRTLWETCDIRLGQHQWMLIGKSSWRRARWDVSRRPPVFIATSDPPSTSMVDILGVEVHPIGSLLFRHWRKMAEPGADRRDPVGVNPISQMTWWMNGNCPAPMSDPDDIDWDTVFEDADLLLDVVTRVQSVIKAPASLTRKGFPAFYALLKEKVDELQALEHKQAELARIFAADPAEGESLQTPMEAPR